MLNINRSLRQIQRGNFNGTLFKNFSEIHHRIVKFSSNLPRTELKVPFEEENYSILLNENDKLSEIAGRINGSSEKLQKVEFLNFSDNSVKDQANLFKEISRSPFKLRINGHYVVKYLPSISSVMSEGKVTEKYFDNNNTLSENNFLLLQTSNALGEVNKSNIQKVLNETKTLLVTKLDKLLVEYEKLEKEYEKGEDFIEKRLKQKKRNLANIALLFVTVHAIVFYWLIYQMFGWDQVEPVTYIVGNVYWIIGLSFFVFKKKKLDFGLIFGSTYRKDFYKTMGDKIGYNEVEKLFIKREICEMKKYKEFIKKL
jgi:hypothetical protein